MIDPRLAKEISRAIDNDQLTNARSLESKDERVGSIAFSYHDGIRNLNIANYNGSLYWFDGRSYVEIDRKEFEGSIFENMRAKGVTAGTIVKNFSTMMKSASMGLMAKELNITKRKLCFTNCILDVDTHEMHQFSEAHHLINRIEYAYNPKAACPKWEKFLCEVLPDKAVRDTMQEYLGLMFVDRSVFKLEKMMVLIGTGSNGKSVVFETITSLVGMDNVTTYEVGDLVGGNNKSYNIANINGKILNYCSELNKKELVGAAAKALISGEPTMCRQIFKEPFMATQIPLIIANANELPATNDHTNGYFRRLLLIPFDVEIKGAQQNVNLHTELKEELSGILNWVLEGRDRVAENGYKVSEPAAVQKKKEDYEQQSNSILMFLSEKMYTPTKWYKDQEIMEMGADDFYNKYREYCFNSGNAPFTAMNFSSKLEAKGYSKLRTRNGKKYKYCTVPMEEDFDELKASKKIFCDRVEWKAICAAAASSSVVQDQQIEEEPENPVYKAPKQEPQDLFSINVPEF